MTRKRETDLFDLVLGALAGAFRRPPRNPFGRPPPKRKPPRDKGGGSETVLVEPDRPKLGSGGAEAPLEYDDRV